MNTFKIIMLQETIYRFEKNMVYFKLFMVKDNKEIQPLFWHSFAFFTKLLTPQNHLF
jgi:hypothetical protein